MANPTSPSLSSLDSLKVSLGIPLDDSSEDASLLQWLLQAEALIRNYLHQDLAIPPATYTEYLNGRETHYLRLRNRPVTEIISVYVDRDGFWGGGNDAFDPGTLLTEGLDYELQKDQTDGSSRSGLLVRLNAVWPGSILRTRGLLSPALVEGRGNVKVVYRAGYEEAPPDLGLAVNLVASTIRLSRLGRPLNSESFQGYSYSLGQGKRALDPLESASSILARYRGLWL